MNAAARANRQTSALRNMALLTLDVELADQTGEFLGLPLDMSREGGTADRVRIERLHGELALDLRRLARPADPADELRHDVLRRLCRRHQPEPDLGVEVLETLLGDRRQF